MDKRDKWTKSLKKGIEDVSMPVGDDLWDGISQGLKRRRLMYIYGRSIIAAASVIIIFIGYFYLSGTKNYDNIQTRQNIEDFNLHTAIKSYKTKGLTIPHLYDRMEIKKVLPIHKIDSKDYSLNSKNIDIDILKDNTNMILFATNKSFDKYEYGKNNFVDADFDRRKAYKGISIGFRYGNESDINTKSGDNLPYADSPKDMFRDYSSDLEYKASEFYLSRTGVNVVDIEMKHETPISFGITVSKHLGKRTYIETGLTYTKLLSKSTNWGNHITPYFSQQFDYIGIPVRINYKILNLRRWNIYIGVGCSFEKNIYANKTIYSKTAKEYSTKERLGLETIHTSLNTALGMQINISRLLGLYVETGINYYPLISSPYKTIRTEYPLSGKAEIGIRFNISRN